MISPDLSLWILGGVTLIVLLYGIKRYGTPLNPLTIFCGTDIGLVTLCSGIVAVSLNVTASYPASVVDAAFLSILYLLGATTAFFLPNAFPQKIYGNALGLLGLRSEKIAAHFEWTKFGLILFGFAVTFGGLVAFTGGHTLWIISPRVAYTNFRDAIGPFWVPANWCLTFAAVYFLWARRPATPLLLSVLCLLCILMSFLGTKGGILTLIIIAVVYRHFLVKPFSIIFYVVLAVAMLLASLVLLVLQGSFGSLAASLVYFQDWFNTTAQFLSRFDEFGYHYGQAWLSGLWIYVPRGLYPGKPFEYGALLVNKVLFPGAAEQGYTPGFLPWTLSYLDFGALGVFISGFITGLCRRTPYEYFLKNRDRFFAFVLMIHFSLFPIWMLAPFLFLLPLMIGQSIFLRLRVRTRGLTARSLDMAEPAPY